MQNILTVIRCAEDFKRYLPKKLQAAYKLFLPSESARHHRNENESDSDRPVSRVKTALYLPCEGVSGDTSAGSEQKASFALCNLELNEEGDVEVQSIAISSSTSSLRAKLRLIPDLAYHERSLGMPEGPLVSLSEANFTHPGLTHSKLMVVITRWSVYEFMSPPAHESGLIFARPSEVFILGRLCNQNGVWDNFEKDSIWHTILRRAKVAETRISDSRLRGEKDPYGAIACLARFNSFKLSKNNQKNIMADLTLISTNERIEVVDLPKHVANLITLGQTYIIIGPRMVFNPCTSLVLFSAKWNSDSIVHPNVTLSEFEHCQELKSCLIQAEEDFTGFLIRSRNEKISQKVAELDAYSSHPPDDIMYKEALSATLDSEVIHALNESSVVFIKDHSASERLNSKVHFVDLSCIPDLISNLLAASRLLSKNELLMLNISHLFELPLQSNADNLSASRLLVTRLSHASYNVVGSKDLQSYGKDFKKCYKVQKNVITSVISPQADRIEQLPVDKMYVLGNIISDFMEPNKDKENESRNVELVEGQDRSHLPNEDTCNLKVNWEWLIGKDIESFAQYSPYLDFMRRSPLWTSLSDIEYEVSKSTLTVLNPVTTRITTEERIRSASLQSIAKLARSSLPILSRGVGILQLLSCIPELQLNLKLSPLFLSIMNENELFDVTKKCPFVLNYPISIAQMKVVFVFYLQSQHLATQWASSNYTVDSFQQEFLIRKLEEKETFQRKKLKKCDTLARMPRGVCGIKRGGGRKESDEKAQIFVLMCFLTGSDETSIDLELVDRTDAFKFRVIHNDEVKPAPKLWRHPGLLPIPTLKMILEKRSTLRDASEPIENDFLPALVAVRLDMAQASQYFSDLNDHEFSTIRMGNKVCVCSPLENAIVTNLSFPLMYIPSDDIFVLSGAKGLSMKSCLPRPVLACKSPFHLSQEDIHKLCLRLKSATTSRKVSVYQSLKFVNFTNEAIKMHVRVLSILNVKFEVRCPVKDCGNLAKYTFEGASPNIYCSSCGWPHTPKIGILLPIRFENSDVVLFKGGNECYVSEEGTEELNLCLDTDNETEVTMHTDINNSWILNTEIHCYVTQMENEIETGNWNEEKSSCAMENSSTSPYLKVDSRDVGSAIFKLLGLDYETWTGEFANVLRDPPRSDPLGSDKPAKIEYRRGPFDKAWRYLCVKLHRPNPTQLQPTYSIPHVLSQVLGDTDKHNNDLLKLFCEIRSREDSFCGQMLCVPSIIASRNAASNMSMLSNENHHDMVQSESSFLRQATSMSVIYAERLTASNVIGMAANALLDLFSSRKGGEQTLAPRDPRGLSAPIPDYKRRKL